jgi:ABC-type sugar transport system substrate-binding protein
MRFLKVVALAAVLICLNAYAQDSQQPKKKLAYLVSDTSIPFWDIMARGIGNKAQTLGYEVIVLSADNSAKKELQNLSVALDMDLEGLIISPTNSSAAVTILNLAQKSNLPVVISDIGTDAGEYVSFISSNNYRGSYGLGKLLARKMQENGISDKTVGIIAIPQKRANGKARTAGFMKALEEEGIKGADMRQQVTFSYQETYDYTKELIQANPNMGALWLQGSDKFQGALDAMQDSAKELLLLCFDAEPVFLELIPKGIIVAAGMQQPFLMGEKAVESMHSHLQGAAIEKHRQLEVLVIGEKNIESELPIIKRNVLGIIE